MNGARQQMIVRLPAWRRRALVVLVLLGFAVLIGRSVYLQGMQKNFLQKKGDARYSRVMTLSAHRGMIMDRHGEPLAISTPVESIWASPADVEASPAQLKKLGALLDIKPADIKKKIANHKREFAYLKRRIPPALAAEVMRLGIPGVFMQREYRRYYPLVKLPRTSLALPVSMKTARKVLSWHIRSGCPESPAAAA